jgi:signal transduction histidine kinase
MSTLTYGDLARTPEAGDAGVSAVNESWPALLRLAVVLASAFFGGVAAHLLLGDPGIQATVVNATTGSAGAVVATLTAYLFVRRMHRTLALADTILAATVTLLPVVSLVAAVTPALNRAAEREFAHFVAATGVGIVASLGLIAAAAVRDRTLGDAKATDGVFASTLLTGAIAVGGVALLAGWADIRVSPDGAGSVVLSAVHLLTAVGTGAAAVAFFRAPAGARHPVLAWIAVAAAIVAAAHLTDALVPWSASDNPFGGNLVQVAAWLALLVGGIRDFEWAQRRDAEEAVLGERRRLARELHDGLAQELAYITTESRRLVGHPGAERLAEAAERALEESRAAILALTRPADEPLERTIAVAAQSIGARAGIDVTVAVRPGLDASAEVRQALLRILREAMSNAARHGRAGNVHVSLDGPTPLVMAIADDGTGFDPGAARRPDSLGLLSMQERALNLGGNLSVESVLGQGTTVAMVLP